MAGMGAAWQVTLTDPGSHLVPGGGLAWAGLEGRPLPLGEWLSLRGQECPPPLPQHKPQLYPLTLNWGLRRGEGILPVSCRGALMGGTPETPRANSFQRGLLAPFLPEPQPPGP